jgi:hypothetical protein
MLNDYLLQFFSFKILSFGHNTPIPEAFPLQKTFLKVPFFSVFRIFDAFSWINLMVSNLLPLDSNFIFGNK